MCIASNIIHHQPIRLDDGFPYHRNISQEVLGRSEGHFCSICHEDCFLCDTDLGTMDTTQPCTHMFCFNCLFQHKSNRIENTQILKCPNCNAVSVDIIRHEWRPGNEVEVITDEPTGCCDWAMDTTLSTGIGNRHEEWCICPLPVDTWRFAFLSRAQWALYKMGKIQRRWNTSFGKWMCRGIVFISPSREPRGAGGARTWVRTTVILFM